MTLAEALHTLASEIGGELTGERDGYRLKAVLAERKTFLSRKKLVYQARIRIDEARREVIFSERLTETGLGLGGGAGDGLDAPGFGFKKETYRVGSDGVRSGSMEEQSRLFGQKYAYRFAFEPWREKIRQAAENAGFALSYRIFQ